MALINAELNVKTPSGYDQVMLTTTSNNVSYENTNVKTALDERICYKGIATKTGDVVSIVVLNLTQTMYSVTFLTQSDFATTDTYTINGVPVTVTNVNNEPLVDAWKNGVVITLNVNNNKAFLESGGSGVANFNLYAQTTEPPIKEGIWLKTADKFDRIEVAEDIHSGGTWSLDPKADLPTPLYGQGCVEVDGKIYNIGGVTGSTSSTYLNTNYVYDANNSIWNNKVNMPIERAFFGCSAVNNNIYCIGGYNGGYPNGIDIYNSKSNLWSSGTPIPSVRRYVLSVSVGNNIYIIGGDEGAPSSKVYIYNTETNTWSNGVDMPTKRQLLGGAVVGRKIYCIGGYSTAFTNVVEIYDVDTNSWTTGANMPTARNGLSCVSVGSKIYCIGATNLVPVTEIYDVPTNTWSTEADMLTPKYLFGSVYYNQKIYAMGGGTALATNQTQTLNLTPTPFPENSLVIQSFGLPQYTYGTQLITSKNLKGDRLITGFENAWIYKNSNLQEYPSYYGDGTKFIKFKN